MANIQNSNNKRLPDNDKIISRSFFEFLYVIAKFKVFLLIFISTITIGAIVLALLTPKMYMATASVLPSEENDLLSSLSGISTLAKSLTPFKGLSSITGTSANDKLLAILESQTVAYKTIEKFDLRKVYELEDQPLWKTVKEFRSNTKFEIAENGNLEINDYDHNPERAANIANYIVTLLNNINTELHAQNAIAIRKFVERRYKKNLDDISALEDSMKEFQEKNGVIAVPQQIDAMIQSLGAIYAEYTKAEISYQILSKIYSSDSPMLKAKKAELDLLRDKLDQQDSSVGSNKMKFLIPFKSVPELAQQYLRIYKNLQIQYKISEFIIPIYEQSKIEEVRNTPSVLVLDHAYPPERKAKPKILLYALIGFATSTLLALLIVFVIELFSKFKEMDPDKYNFIIRSIRFKNLN